MSDDTSRASAKAPTIRWRPRPVPSTSKLTATTPTYVVGRGKPPHGQQPKVSNDTSQACTSPPTNRRRSRTTPMTSELAPALPPYVVGRGRPPREHQFKAGRSGNPKGRPRGSRGVNTIIRTLLEQKVSIRTPKGVRKVAYIEALLLKTIELASKGDQRAIERCIAFYRSAVPDELPATPARDADELAEADRVILELHAQEILAAAQSSSSKGNRS